MIYFTSDPHFWHGNIIKYCNRPFKDAIEMNDALIKNWNATVGSEDTVYCLGDLSMAIRPVETITPNLNGKKFLVPGNHDWVHSTNKKSKVPGKKESLVKEYSGYGWEVLPEQMEFNIPGVANVILCHLPYVGESVEGDKFNKVRPKDEGKWLICGHVHNNWKVKDKMINVGVDVWDFKPISIEVIKDIILNKISY
jgi:calcineurin-like phosphoesterase family protein